MAVATVVEALQGVTISGAAAWAALIGLVTLFVRQRPSMRKLAMDRDNSLTSLLTARVDKLEAALDREREMRWKMQKDSDAKIEKMSADHDAILAILRHRLNNVTSCLDALLLLLERDPGSVADAIATIREMRGRQEVAEATEKAAIHANRISAAGEGA